jgi:hypothetical protein
MLHRYPIKLGFSSNTNRINNFFWDFESQYLDEPIIKIEPDTIGSKLTPKRNDASFRNIELALQSGIQLRNTDSTGVAIQSSYGDAHRFNQTDWSSTFLDSRLFYRLNIPGNDHQIHAVFNGGINIESNEDSLALCPVWHAGIDFVSKHQQIRAYLKQDNIPYSVPFDSSNEERAALLDNYSMGGIEYLLQSKKAQLLLGYQYLSNVSRISISNAWAEGILPYEQPRSVFIIAPAFGRWNGFALSGSGSFSDEKPYIKAKSQLSYVFHPLSTNEFVDVNVGFEYWSEREPVTFADRSDWNKEIYNLNLEISAHILSFRLFYKVDNILNRKFAYIPGYYSSGLTFRWGFNWFIQR